MTRTYAARGVLIAFVLMAGTTSAAGQEAARGAPASVAPEIPASSGEHVAPVVVDGVTLFSVRGLSAFPAERRAQEVADRIASLAAESAAAPPAVRLVPTPEATYVSVGGQRVIGVFDADARVEGVERDVLARAYASRIEAAITAYRRDRRPDVLTRHALYAAGWGVALALVLWFAHWVLRRMQRGARSRYQARLRDVQFQSFQFVRAEQLWRLLGAVLEFCWFVALLGGVYLYLQDVLPRFPWTRGIGIHLSGIVIDPLRTMAAGVIASIPDLVFLAILVAVTRYLLKVTRLFFERVAAGQVTLTNFDPEWAAPTYRLIRLFIVAFAAVVAYPYIPGSGSDAFKGVSLFIGLVFSLGSSSLISNAIAGYSMTYRRAFRVGDRVKIGQHIGDVERMRLMVTHLRTPKNEEVVVPNSLILSTEVVNYSSLAGENGLILHTTVGIGYETPWRQVEAMLRAAAARTPGLLPEPPPFVLQKALGDFCITYEINVYCREARQMNQLYSALHQNILDVFNEYGVQIMTPAYENDPEQPKVVPKSNWYAAPAPPLESQEMSSHG